MCTSTFGEQPSYCTTTLAFPCAHHPLIMLHVPMCSMCCTKAALPSSPFRLQLGFTMLEVGAVRVFHVGNILIKARHLRRCKLPVVQWPVDMHALFACPVATSPAYAPAANWAEGRGKCSSGNRHLATVHPHFSYHMQICSTRAAGGNVHVFPVVLIVCRMLSTAPSALPCTS